MFELIFLYHKKWLW